MKKETHTKFKILTVIGTRPEIIKLSETIRELDRHTEHVLVHTGQNYDYELNEIFFSDLGLRKPDYFLQESGGTHLSLAGRIGMIFTAIEPILAREKPDAFLVLGDTNSALAAYVAKRQKIPIFHMEAGNRCFDERVPEEINRKIIDHLADINMVYSERARDNLIREGLPLDRILLTGSPMYEVLEAHKKSIEGSSVLKRLKVSRRGYFVASFHREENVEDRQAFNNILKILSSVADAYNKPIIFSAHPRTRAKIEKGNIRLPRQVHMMKPLGFFDYVALQKNALCVLSDSGTISEESAILDFAALNVRQTHERLEAMDEAAVTMTGLSPERVLQGLAIVTKQHGGRDRQFRIPDSYSHPNFSKKALRMILSYIDFVNRSVWGKR